MGEVCAGMELMVSSFCARSAKAYPELMPNIAVVESPSVRILADRAGARREVFDFFSCVGVVIVSCLFDGGVGMSGSLIISHHPLLRGRPSRLLHRRGHRHHLHVRRIRRLLHTQIRRRPQFDRPSIGH